jgi:hypothetical protein
MTITELPKQPEVIYESPDQGNTVYARKIGSSERKLVYKTYQSPYQPWVERWSNSQDMFKAAQDNPALDDLLKKAEMVYALTK